MTVENFRAIKVLYFDNRCPMIEHAGDEPVFWLFPQVNLVICP
jgi:hypothetical protein